MTAVGPIGRLGRWSADHVRIVVALWIVALVGLGVFAPSAEHALSGAGWEDSGSESVAARQLIDENFQGMSGAALMVVVHSETLTATDPAFQDVVAKATTVLDGSDAVTVVQPPVEGQTLSRDGHTAVLMAGAARDTTGMVHAADTLKGELAKQGTDAVRVDLTGASGMWSDFNQANKDAMIRSELLSWPVTLAILMVAFGAVVAATLPLMLTIISLAMAAGALYLSAQVADVSIWAMNFALMFALALGIDYALFIVQRFRGAFMGSHLTRQEAVAVTQDTAGKAVLFSGLTVLIALSAVMIVPSPAFRSMALGIMLSVIFILAASLTLLPAVLGRLGDGVNRWSLPWVHTGEHRSPAFARWGERLWQRPGVLGVAATVILLVLAVPILGLRTGMPSITVVPEGDGARVGYEQVQKAFGVGAPGSLQLVGPTADVEAAAKLAASDTASIAFVSPVQPGGGGLGMAQAIPTVGPNDPALGDIIDNLRSTLPTDVLVGGASAENHDLEAALGTYTPLAIGIILVLGFVLLLVALQAPVAAAIGVLSSLLATGAAFGVARMIFQEGWLTGPLNFEAQGFLDAWGPIFFFAMIFAISMDYTVFLMSSAKEHWDRSHDPHEAMVGGLAHSGRVILAAAAVMVAVFFTFALSGPLPPKEMGIILGVAVLLDAVLVRLLLVPVMLRLVGRAAWWQPRWLDRILPDVRFGH
ncbi:MAG: MMPL family transporter [Actinobacteria bacterium]|nr:MMPL family transporter [Thermoleophilia bacterium]MCB9012074.1 MMPL family transporter [Actinomycetota bacterium]